MSEFDKVLDDIKEREIGHMIEIEKLKAQLSDCVNFLCYKCGAYEREHLGACDLCKWKAVKEGFR